MTVLLPRNDPARTARQAALAKARDTYRYNHAKLAPLTLADQLPRAEEFSLDWIFQVAERTLTVLDNHSEYAGDPDGKRAHGLFSGLLRSLAMDLDGLVKVFSQVLGVSKVSGHFESLADYDAVFRKIPMPAVASDWADDATFAEMRVAGPNPLMITRITSPDPRLPLEAAAYARALPGDDLDAALAEGRVYLADYALLEGTQDGLYPGEAKYLCAPLALFAVRPGSGKLAPVAIQCGQIPGADRPIFTPQDGTAWLMAKTVVEIADGNYHQAISHLGRTHLFVEPFVIATHRQLAPNHPLFLLLEPHFLFTLAINDMAFDKLVNVGGPVDELLAGTIEATRGLTAKGLAGLQVESLIPTLACQARGVDAASALSHYPYRDDALPYWAAIRRWVGDYLAIYYREPEDLAQDTELAGWIRELAAPDGGRVAGVSVEHTLASVDRLADVVAVVIFTASVQHAAVNFPQYDCMTFVPNMPLAGYTPPPKGPAHTADLLAMLSGRRATLLQMALGYVLGTLHYTTLGGYAKNAFDDERVTAPLKRFQDELAAAGRAVDARNAVRRPYPFLVASGIPQSINI